MDKKSLIILFATSCFASSSFATNIVNQLIAQHSSTPSIAKAQKNTYKTPDTYTAFSGTWSGVCNDKMAIKMDIENDAESISFGGDESRIGRGLESMSSANEDYVTYEHRSFEWNKDGSALIMQGANVYKDNEDSSPIEMNMSNFMMTMKNGQINMDGTFNYTRNSKNESVAIHCVMSKQK